MLAALLAHDGWEVAAEAGRDAIEVAVRDFSDIHGHGVALVLPGNSMCAPAGGSAAGLVMISPSNTSPSLT